MESLLRLGLCGCKSITGNLPSELGLLSRIEVMLVPGIQIYLSHAGLTGTIPQELFSDGLRALTLDGNQLSGTISPLVGMSTNLLELSLADNNLSGTLPEEISMLFKLFELDISGNPLLTGSIPDQLCWSSQYFKLVADCASGTEQLPNLCCPAGCCSICCDAETSVCTSP